MSTTTASAAVFTFDKDYDNYAQIAPLYPAYTARLRELDTAGQYPYNDSFRGHLGVEAGEDEDTAIYLCQGLTHLHETALSVNEFIDAGGRFLTDDDRPAGLITVAQFGWYMGGTGFRVNEDVRLMYRAGQNRPYMLLPKGKRTRGYTIESGAVVLVKE